MADLDDFFAKKDRKKSKGKKFLTADELVKNLEDTSKREPPKAKKEPTPAAAEPQNAANSVANENNENNSTPDQVQQVSSTIAAPTEEEWKEIEVERKDYSGLKIGQLNINDDNTIDGDNHDGENYDDEDNEGNENQSSDNKGHCPWKKVIPAEEVTQIHMPSAPASTTPSLYRPPGLKNSQNDSLRMNKVRKGIAPDITNEDYFPTLGAARPEEQKKKKNEPAFEEVRHGGRMQRVQEKNAAPVAVENRFKSLDDDDS